MVFDALRRMLSRGKEGGSVSAEQAEMRLKALKAQLVKNKSEAKRLFSENQKSASISVERKAANKARLKELDREKADILKEMKAMQRRLPKR